jgi:hypothetical protein
MTNAAPELGAAFSKAAMGFEPTKYRICNPNASSVSAIESMGCGDSIGGGSSSDSNAASARPGDRRLELVVSGWDRLPEAVRAGIAAMVVVAGQASGGKGGRT